MKRSMPGLYSITAPGIDKSTNSKGGAIIYAQRLCEQGSAETVYVRDALGAVVARIEVRGKEVLTYAV